MQQQGLPGVERGLQVAIIREGDIALRIAGSDPDAVHGARKDTGIGKNGLEIVAGNAGRALKKRPADTRRRGRIGVAGEHRIAVVIYSNLVVEAQINGIQIGIVALPGESTQSKRAGVVARKIRIGGRECRFNRLWEGDILRNLGFDLSG